MPTGYTAAIGEGATFKDFILGCARNFGACIEMRDEPADAPIPDSFPPSDYHTRKLDEANALLAKLKAMPCNECEREAVAEYKREVQYHNDAIAKEDDLRVKYVAMLNQVDAWQPPSPDHVGLKDFMSKQIADSIDFDCNTGYHKKELKKLSLMSGSEWRQSAIDKALLDISYHSKAQQEENERAASRTKWIRQLRDSITPIIPTP